MLTEEDIAALAAAKIAEECQHDHLWYRINATRHLGGNPKLTPSFSDRLHEVFIFSSCFSMKSLIKILNSFKFRIIFKF